jgi:hypothetical protein
MLRVVLLAMDPARLLIGFVLHVDAFARGDHAIGLGATLDAVEVNLSGGQTTRLARGQLAALRAIHDALALMMLAGVVTRSGRENRPGNQHGQGRENH